LTQYVQGLGKCDGKLDEAIAPLARIGVKYPPKSRHMASRQVKARIDAIFPRLKNGEGVREVARELGVHHSTIQDYRKGKYWLSLEKQWQERQAKLKAEEQRVQQSHIEQHGDRYRLQLEDMRDRLVELSQRFLAISDRELYIVQRALLELQREINQGRSPVEACSIIQKKGISKTALDAAYTARAARENFAESYGLNEILKHLEEIIENLGGSL